MVRFLKTLIRCWFTPVGLTVLIVTQAAAVTPEDQGRASREGSVFRVEGQGGDLEFEAVLEGTGSPGPDLDIPGSDITGPVEEEETYGEYLPEISGESLANPDDPTSDSSGRVSPERESGYQAEHTSFQGGAQPMGGGLPPGNEPMWGDDILIHAGSVAGHADWDEDEMTSDLYTIVDLERLVPDTSLIYRSTDGGDTWDVWGRVVNTDGFIHGTKIRLARDGAGQTWVCVIGIWEEPSAGWVRNLWMGRKLASGGSWVWSMVHDNVEEADADADVGNGAGICVVYIPVGTENDIWAARHTLSGAWQNNQVLFTNPGVAFPSPQVAAGAGGNVAVTFLDTRLSVNEEVRVKRSNDGGVTWLASQQVSNNLVGYPLYWADIASSHGGTQKVWISVTFDVSSAGQGYNVAYYYSSDSGVTWTYGGLIGYSTNDEYESTLRARKADGSVAMAYSAGQADSVKVSWAPATDPTGFSPPARVDDGGTLVLYPVAGWLTRGETSWPGALFDHWNGFDLVDVYMDWAGNGTFFLVLEPDATVIPRGGILGMWVYVTNATSIAQTVDFWTNVTLPNGHTYPADETLVGPIQTTIPAGATLSGRLVHKIAGNTPLNTYTYNAFMGPGFPTVWASDSFSFKIVAAGVLAGVVGEAGLWGEEAGE